MNYEMILKVVFIILLIPGILGSVVPILPGILYMLFMAVLYAVLSSFHFLSGSELLILAGIALLSVVIDFLSGAIGARMGGASSSSIVWGIIGFIFGLILFPPFGAFLGLFAGVLLAEYQLHKNPQLAVRSATFSVLGKTVGIIFNLGLAILFFGLSIFFVFF